MCSETVGVAPVSRWMTPQSSSLSKMSRGSPGRGSGAKRVPPVPTPQEGTATPKPATRSLIAVDGDAAAVELLAERVIVALEVLRRGGGRVGLDHAHGGRSYRVKAWTLPASTLRMLPVDLAESSEAKK